MRFILPIVFSVILEFAVAFGAVFNVEVITDLNDINAMYRRGNTLFLATSGGFVAYNLNSGTYSVYTVADGLASQQFTTMIPLPEGEFALGGLDGSLNFIDPESHHIYAELSIQGKPILKLITQGDTLWALRKDFLAVFLRNPENNRYEFRDFFGNFPFSSIELRDVAITSNHLWLATSAGVLRAPTNFTRYNLRDANTWQLTAVTFEVNKIAVTDTALALLTSNGFYWYNFQSVSLANEGLISADPQLLQQVAVYNNRLWLATKGRIYLWDTDHFEMKRNVGSTITSFVVDSLNQIYLGKKDQGLFLADKTNIHFPGPFNNYIGETLVDSRGWVWCTAGMYKDQQRSGVSVLTDDGWYNFFYFGNLIWSSASVTNSVFEDAGGNVWVGSWGGGLQIYSPELDVTLINPETSTGNLWRITPFGEDTLTVQSNPDFRNKLSGVISNPNYAVVTGMTADTRRNGIWLINNEARNNRPLIFYGENAYSEAGFADPGKWYTFSQPIGGLHKNKLFRIVEDIFGFLWVASERIGVIQIEVTEAGTLNYKDWNETDDNLKSNNTLAIAADADGYVWIGTKSGLNVYTGGLIYDMRGDYHPIGLVINDIYIDSRNNKWFATDKGISFVNGSGSPFEGKNWYHIVPRTSEKVGSNIFYADLPSPNIHSIFLDEQNGDLYAGTDAGLVILHDNPFSGSFTDFSSVKAGPNPFIISEDNANQFTIFNLVNGSEVRILAPNGQLVRVLSPSDFNEVSGAQATWDGKDENGNFVNSGVYLYFVTNDNGASTGGKVLVIRQ